MGTSNKPAAGEGFDGAVTGAIWGDVSVGEHPAVFADRVIGRALHGDSYSVPHIPEGMLRYHNMPDVASAAGSMVIGGERFDG